MAWWCRLLWRGVGLGYIRVFLLSLSHFSPFHSSSPSSSRGDDRRGRGRRARGGQTSGGGEARARGLPEATCVSELRRFVIVVEDHSRSSWVVIGGRAHLRVGSSTRTTEGVTRNSHKVDVLAKSVGNMWYLIDSSFSFSLEDKICQDGMVLELVGGPHMRLYPGRKLEFESRYYNIDQKDNHDFITVIMFTKNNPYGKSLALVDLKSGVLEVTEEWFVFPGMVLACVLVYTMKTEGHDIFVSTKESEYSEQVDESKKVQMVEEKNTGAPEDVE